MLYTPDYYKPILDSGETPVTIAIPLHNGICSLAYAMIHFIAEKPELLKKYPLVSHLKDVGSEQLFQLGSSFTLWEFMIYLAEGEKNIVEMDQADAWKLFTDKYAEDYCRIRMQWDPVRTARMTSVNVAIRRLINRNSIEMIYLYDDLVEYDKAIQALIAVTFPDLLAQNKIVVLANRLEDVYATYPTITNCFADDIHQLFHVIDNDHSRWPNTAFCYNRTRIHNYIRETIKDYSFKYWIPEYAEQLAKFQEDPDFHLYGYTLYPDLGG